MLSFCMLSISFSWDEAKNGNKRRIIKLNVLIKNILWLIFICKLKN